MKMKDLVKKDAAELQDMIIEAEKEKETLSFAVFAGEEQGVRKLRSLKKDIARMKTRLAQLTLTDSQK